MHRVSYDLVASEYYDVSHKTCRNFDAATKEALKGGASPIPPDGMILEVGCGRGSSQEFLKVAPSRIVQLDSSQEMLNIEARETCLLMVYGDATSIPLHNAQFSAVVGFLIDPFIGLAFFAEASRVLKPGGVLFITTPTPDWGISLRGEQEPNASHANFILKSKKQVMVPSTLISKQDLEIMLQHAGFADIKIDKQSLPQGTEPISPDIQVVADKKKMKVHDLPIIYVVRATKH